MKKYIDNYNFDLIFNELLEHFIEFYKRRIENKLTCMNIPELFL